MTVYCGNVLRRLVTPKMLHMTARPYSTVPGFTLADNVMRSVLAQHTSPASSEAENTNEQD